MYTFDRVLCARFEQVNAVAAIHRPHASHVIGSCERHRVLVQFQNCHDRVCGECCDSHHSKTTDTHALATESRHIQKDAKEDTKEGTRDRA